LGIGYEVRFSMGEGFAKRIPSMGDLDNGESGYILLFFSSFESE